MQVRGTRQAKARSTKACVWEHQQTTEFLEYGALTWHV